MSISEQVKELREIAHECYLDDMVELETMLKEAIDTMIEMIESGYYEMPEETYGQNKN